MLQWIPRSDALQRVHNFYFTKPLNTYSLTANSGSETLGKLRQHQSPSKKIGNYDPFISYGSIYEHSKCSFLVSSSPLFSCRHYFPFTTKKAFIGTTVINSKFSSPFLKRSKKDRLLRQGGRQGHKSCLYVGTLRYITAHFTETHVVLCNGYLSLYV